MRWTTKQRLFKVVTLLGMPALLILAAESVLALLDYGTTYQREDPFLGFKSVTPLFEEKPRRGASNAAVYATRPSKLAWFNHQEFRADKPDNGYRIFAFGGSTTFGRPYDYHTAFPNWVRVLLDAADPSTDYEVVNVGGVSYASYRVVHLMNEIVRYEPDLFIVYSGHNEFLEERTYSEILEEPPLVTRLRSQLHHSRTYSLVRDLWLGIQRRERARAEEKFQMSGEVTAVLDQSFGLEQYQRDPQHRTAILRHFRYNLERMVDIAEKHDVPLVFVVPSSNEKDFSPFKSQFCRRLQGAQRRAWNRWYDLGRTALMREASRAALDAFRRAIELDSCHADLRYRTGEALFALGRYREAKHEFVNARDLDVAPLRGTSRIQEIVRDVARTRRIPTIDLAQMLASRKRKRSGHTILGKDEFLDHVHPTIRVHQTLAEEVVQALIREDWIHPKTPLGRINAGALYDREMANRDSSYYAIRDLNVAKVLSWAGKIEEAAPFVARAAEALQDHPEAQYLLGVLYQYDGRFEEAARAYRRAIALDPTFSRAHNALGSVYERTGRWDEAIASIREALRHQPESDHAYYSLGNALYQSGRPGRAIEAYRRALELNPRHSQAWNNLAAVYITQEKYDEALEALRRTLELEPENVSAFRNLGLIHYNRGRPDRARAMFERVLEVDPDNAYAHRWLVLLDQEANE